MSNIQKLSRSLFENGHRPSCRRVREFQRCFDSQLPPGSSPLFDHAIANVGRLFKIHERRAGADYRSGNISLL
jgi:hypothetical protein